MHGSHDLGGHLLSHEYTNSGKDIFQQCVTVIKKQIALYENSQLAIFDTSLPNDHLLHIPGYVRRIGVWVGDLLNANVIAEPLFPEFRKNKKLDEIVDKLNEKFGEHTVRNGFLLYAKKLKTVPNGFMGDRYERVKLAKEI